jgi:thiol-disulfide isomerase/thioredoxin
LIYDEVKFSDFPINLTTSETVEYKVTVTPNYEGAVSSELTGSIAVPQEDYLNNVVVEELTATGCTYCPSGMAAMEYYSENYKGSEDEGKFIGIALHGAINYQDPMGTDIMNSYVTPFMDSNSYTSYPQARFNRATTAKQPTDLSSFTSQLIQPTYTETKISSVVTPSANVQAGDEIKVYFDTKMGYDINDIDLNAAVVLVENDVQGNSTDYSQTNYFATTDESFITQNYGAWLLPYMQVYLNSPSTIRFDQIKYQHVARGIFPQFDGTPLPFKDFKWGESRRAMLSFNLPESVMNWENTEVVVMILDVESGKIVASDICSAANYDTTSVKNVASSATKINREGNNISIKAEDGSAVSVYSVDGSLLGSYVVENGNLYVDGSSFNGVVIVRVNGVNEVNTAKLLF